MPKVDSFYIYAPVEHHTYNASCNDHVMFYAADIMKAISNAGFQKPSPIQVCATNTLYF